MELLFWNNRLDRFKVRRRLFPFFLLGLLGCASAPKSTPNPIPTEPKTVQVEAETGTMIGLQTSTAIAGFSGTGYVTGFDEATDKLTLMVNAPAGLYEVWVGYSSPTGDKGVDFQVNDEKGSGTLRQTSSGFSSAKLGMFRLQNGQNTVAFFRGWGHFYIDYVRLTPATVLPPAKPPRTLIDTRATASTRALFSYLIDQYGSKVLSGQQDDVEYILEKTGKEPAIGSFDLMEYSPSRVQRGVMPQRSSEACIAWAKKGEGRGIVSLLWHWNAPMDLIDEEPDKLWWSGFYTRATTFDLAAVLADKPGERYQLLLRDIDVIAGELKKFQTADVPVLWRPLHETPGSWFWWGAKGPEPFKELWRLLYDRLTNHHQLHNLIWVYAGTDSIHPDWYPGDSYVDMVGLDIYTDATASLSGNWSNTQALFNGKKMVALTETGNLLDPVKRRDLGIWWSWFSVWTGDDHIKKQPVEKLKAVYTDKDVITRDELPDWRSWTGNGGTVSSHR
ncbi:glycosyl hydrolase [Larkinella harenae]